MNNADQMNQLKKRFGLIGAAGYIAPKHMKAIRENNCDLIAALDPNDSVGILDRYFPKTSFFTSFERFERFVVKLKSSNPLDYISVCSPNYHHDTHCRFALNNNCHAVCEKPLVLTPWNFDALQKSEGETGFSIYNILQLRLHPEIIKLKERIDKSTDEVFDIDLTYITSRGPWYYISWKGDEEKSGGIISNIGIHFFDMLLWIFGKPKSKVVHVNDPKYASGFLQLQKANIRWFLSVDAAHLPEDAVNIGQSVFRSLTINNKDINFTDGFENLHTKSYNEILNGNGFTTSEVEQVTHLSYDLRQEKPVGKQGEFHPFLSQISC